MVKSGFGNNSKTLAVIFAAIKGKGKKNLFFPIEFKRIYKISLNVRTSGPTHSTIFEFIFFFTILIITSVKSEQ